MHRFIADDWPAWLWLRIAPLSVPAAICWYLEPLPWLLESWYHPPLFAWVLIIAWALGWFGAILVGAPILGTIYHGQGLRNGAPYSVGDTVRILTRRHDGRVARVYEVWESRDQVRVELGEVERSRVEDVFSYHQIIAVSRAVKAEPNKRID